MSNEMKRLNWTHEKNILIMVKFIKNNLDSIQYSSHEISDTLKGLNK